MNPDLKTQYGYLDRRVWDLDAFKERWAATQTKPWQRLFELKGVYKGQALKPDTSDGLTAEDARRFTRVSRDAFKNIAIRHTLSPTEMWQLVADGLLAVGMHIDDLDDVQKLLFGWKDLDAVMLERYRWRYPDRCPLLDVLCTMDESFDELNALQDWILELKGSKDRRRLDLLPALPEPDGCRPCACPG